MILARRVFIGTVAILGIWVITASIGSGWSDSPVAVVDTVRIPTARRQSALLRVARDGGVKLQSASMRRENFLWGLRGSGCHITDESGTLLGACENGAVLYIEGSQLSPVSVTEVFFLSAEFEASGPNPLCASVEQGMRNVQCVINTDEGPAGLFNVYIRDKHQIAYATEIFVEFGTRPTITGITGCHSSRGACRSGSIITVHGGGFAESNPQSNLIDFIEFNSTLKWFESVKILRSRPACRVINGTQSEVICALHVPPGANGLWCIVPGRFVEESAAVIAVVASPIVTPLIVDAVGCKASRIQRQYHTQATMSVSLFGCSNGDRITLAATDILDISATVEFIWINNNQMVPKCNEIEVRHNLISCALESLSSLDDKEWQVLVLNKGTPSNDINIMIHFDPRINKRAPYDPLLFPHRSPFPTELRKLPLSGEWSKFENISVVFTYVNGTNSTDQRLRRLYGGESKVNNAQNRDNNELAYAFRSMAKYMPWHKGMIYIVTPGHIPYWLNVSHPRIVLIDQDDLFPDKRVLPTFSSNAIEPFLYRIPGLTEHFLQLNDDYFYLNDIHPADFFTVDGGIRIAMGSAIVRADEKFDRKKEVWKSSTMGTWDMVVKAYGETKRYYLKHAPFVYFRDVFPYLHGKWGQQINLTASHKFRHYEDIITPILHNYFVYNEGKRLGFHAEPIVQPELDREFRFIGVKNDVKNALEELQKILLWKPRFYNINDLFSNKYMSWIIHQFLDHTYNEPCEFELPGLLKKVPLPPHELEDELQEYGTWTWLSNSPLELQKRARTRK